MRLRTKLHYLHLTFKFIVMRALRFTLSTFFVILSTLLFSQDSSFPNDWLGVWEGELEIFAGPKKVNSLPMSLEIEIVDSLTIKYFIRYGTGPDALRPYHLKVIDAKKGHYLLDEHNGIRIETSLVGNRLLSLFEVQNSVIQSTAYLTNDQMYYEILAGSFKPVSMTGDTIVGTDTIPAVSTYPINVLQQAILKRH